MPTQSPFQTSLANILRAYERQKAKKKYEMKYRLSLFEGEEGGLAVEAGGIAGEAA